MVNLLLMQVEPNAEMRQLAAHLWQMHSALTQEGFSEDRSLKIIAEAIRAGVQGRGEGS